ncbi:UBA-like domain DUF1421, partial [Dillenia turbinata]
MNTSQFMDKQIMDLSNSQRNNNSDFIDLMNPQEDDNKKDDTILPNYDFQPIRPIAGASLSSSLDGATANRLRSSLDSKTNTAAIRSYNSLDSIEPTKVILEKDCQMCDSTILSEIDRTMKKHADDIMHMLESVSARLTQLESRTRHLENSVDDLKDSVGNNNGSIDGKMRQLENILRECLEPFPKTNPSARALHGSLPSHHGLCAEPRAFPALGPWSSLNPAWFFFERVSLASFVHSPFVARSKCLLAGCIHLAPLSHHVQMGVQVIRDKQEMVEAQFQLAKLQVPKVDVQTEAQNIVHADSQQQVASAPQQSVQQLPPVVPRAPPPLTPPSVPPPPMPQPNPPAPIQVPNQFNQVPSLPQRDPYFPSPSLTQEAANQQFQLPSTQQLQSNPPVPPHQQYQPAPHAPYHPPLQPPQQHPLLAAGNPPPLPPPIGHHPEEPAYIPSQSYPSNLRQPPSHQPSGAPSSQPYYVAPSHMYEPPPSRSSSGYSSTFGPQPGTNEPYPPFSGSPAQYGSGSPVKVPQLSSSMGSGSGSGYPQLPTARVLPHALPASTPGGSGSSGTGNRVPIDDVVDKVTNMGFPRDHVRAAVRKLTENGQSVDLNVVLDKLMNDGDVQPPRNWFG